MGFFNISTMSGVFLLVALIAIMIAVIVKLIIWSGKEGNSEKIFKKIHSLFKMIGSLAKTITAVATQKTFERVIPKSRQPKRRMVVKPIPLRPIEEYREEEVDTATRLLDLYKQAEELERSDALKKDATQALSELDKTEILNENTPPKFAITVNEEEKTKAIKILQLREVLKELDRSTAILDLKEDVVNNAGISQEEQTIIPTLPETDNAEIAINDDSEIANENEVAIPSTIPVDEMPVIIEEEQANDIADTVAISEKTSIINLDEKSPDAVAVAKLIRSVDKETKKKIIKAKEDDVNIIEKILELKNKIVVGKSAEVKKAYENLLISGLTRQTAENFNEAGKIDLETLTDREAWLLKKDELLIEEDYVSTRYLQHHLEIKNMQEKLLDKKPKSTEVKIPKLEEAPPSLLLKSSKSEIKSEIEKILSEVK